MSQSSKVTRDFGSITLKIPQADYINFEPVGLTRTINQANGEVFLLDHTAGSVVTLGF